MINDMPLQATASRESKAATLMYRMNAFQDIISRLHNIVDQIQMGQLNKDINEKVPTAEQQNQSVPSISRLLTEGSETLVMYQNNMNDLIDQIEQELF